MRFSKYSMFALLGLMLSLTVQAQPHPVMIRDFWYPLFHAERLDYCLMGQQLCGHEVANRYCRLMGYRLSKTEQIEYHVGLTHYLDERSQCKGWQCHGFKLITCVGPIKTSPKAEYLAHSRKFAVPRKDQYRVAWCYAKGHQCGKRAAYAFCRLMGYGKVTHYEKQSKLPATRTLGDKTLCFEKNCSGFASITCYR